MKSGFLFVVQCFPLLPIDQQLLDVKINQNGNNNENQLIEFSSTHPIQMQQMLRCARESATWARFAQ